MEFDNIKELSNYIKKETEEELKKDKEIISLELKNIHDNELKEIEIQKKIKNCKHCRWVACKNYGYAKPICNKFINKWELAGK